MLTTSMNSTHTLNANDDKSAQQMKIKQLKKNMDLLDTLRKHECEKRVNPVPMPEYPWTPKYPPVPMPEYPWTPKYPPVPMPEYPWTPKYPPVPMPQDQHTKPLNNFCPYCGKCLHCGRGRCC